MEQDAFWQTNSHSLPHQRICHILWNLKVHYCVQKSPILIHINPTYTIRPYFFQIILISSHLFLGLPSGSSFKFPHQDPVCISRSPNACYMPQPICFLHLIALIIFDGEYKSWSSSLCSFLHPVFPPFRPTYLPQCPIFIFPLTYET